MSNADAYVLKGAKLLDSKSCGVKSCGGCKGGDRAVAGNWRTVIKAKGDKLDMGGTSDCVLGTLFKDADSLVFEDTYSKGLKALGLESGFQYGFDAPADVSYSELKNAWLEYVGFKVAPKVEEVRYTLGDKLIGRWYSGTALRLDENIWVDGVKYFVGTEGSHDNGTFKFHVRKPDLYTAEGLTKDFVRKAPFTAKEGDLITSPSAKKVWYIGSNNRAWVVKDGVPAFYTGLSSVVSAHSDIQHYKTASADKLVGYSSSY